MHERRRTTGYNCFLMIRRILFIVLAVAVIAIVLAPSFPSWAFSLTGEEETLPQIRGLLDLSGQIVRPPLDLRPDAPIMHAEVNPYGINTFLQLEVEPAKREKQVQLIAEAGFHWLRQEFPWYDIEISGKGDFEDCRFPPCHSAWDKYDQIVDLADKYGLEIIARLSSTPEWARTKVTGTFAPPDNYPDFADYAVAVAQRYRGRVRYFQLWNEPNGNAEWGDQPVDPEGYTRLLCEAYRRLKAVDPDIVVLAAALTPTNEVTGDNLNEFVYLQRMYDAGAGACFDIMSAQGYGLWSGPTDHRLNPITVNYSRHVYLRDLMVRNGDEHKAIWISEMNWNAVPPESGLPANYGRATLEQQARWAPLAYERAQKEWPWIGVINFWFFKRADDSEKNRTWYYFRMAEPDFTLMPVYEAMKAYIAAHPYSKAP
ncbi:MAG TPA: cellulase family glycosylhydrolase [Anaerolineales bacterium]|nr:cellulase family glycosylhydrolase [Anaerolineales bacterium]